MFVFAGMAKHFYFIAICGALFSTTGVGSSAASDKLSGRDTSIHWPAAFDPRTAPVFAHNDLLIQASCHRVWTRLVDVTDWPNWFVLTKDVMIDGPEKTLGHGTLLHLKIFGSPIEARIDEYVPDTRLSWFPRGLDEPAPKHYHTWLLVPEGTGCRVVTEESGVGPNDVKTPEANSKLVHRAHDLWLASLRWTSEQ